jgi:uncharacterized protein (TIGR02145 family)
LTNTTLDAATPTTIATILVGDDVNPSRFYIVANVNGTGVKSDALKNLAVGASESDFDHAYTNALAVDANGNLALIGTPLPMSVRDAAPTANGYITVASPSTEGIVHNVHLKRRVARFDIINAAAYTNFEVTRVIITNAQRSGWMHDAGFNAASDPFAASTGKTIVNASTANGPAVSGLDNDGNGIDDDYDNGIADSLFLTPSAFYLWPTEMKELSPETATEILIEGKYYNGITRLYKLDLTGKGTVLVEANKVYRIKVIRSLEKQLKFELIVDDWEDTVDIETDKTEGTVTWANVTATSSGGKTFDLTNFEGKDDCDSLEYSSSATAPVTLTIVCEGTNLTGGANNHVTAIQILSRSALIRDDGLQGDLDATRDPANIVSETRLTYGVHYITKHTITLAPTDAPLISMLRITNAANEQDYRLIKLVSKNYAKTGYAPVVVGNLLWAPVNVGATNLPDTKANFANDANGESITGHHFQWGRNVPFLPTDANVSTKAAQGPLAPDLAADTTVFIKSTGDWLSVGDNDLWGGVSSDRVKMQGPCPPGWRVPTKDEWAALIAATSKTNASNNWYTWTVTATNTILYFQNGGLRSSTGTVVDYAGQTGPWGLFWTASTDVSGNAYRIYLTNNSPSLSAPGNPGDNKARGYSIRAVRDIPTPP